MVVMFIRFDKRSCFCACIVCEGGGEARVQFVNMNQAFYDRHYDKDVGLCWSTAKLGTS